MITFSLLCLTAVFGLLCRALFIVYLKLETTTQKLDAWNDEQTIVSGGKLGIETIEEYHI